MEKENKEEINILFHMKDRKTIMELETFIPTLKYDPVEKSKSLHGEYGKFLVNGVIFRAMGFCNLDIKKFKHIFPNQSEEEAFLEEKSSRKSGKIIYISNWDKETVSHVMLLLLEFIYTHAETYPPRFKIYTGTHFHNGVEKEAIFLEMEYDQEKCAEAHKKEEAK